MRFSMTSDWPVNGGALIVPVGTVLEANLANPDFQYNGTKLPETMPLTAMALDQDAYDAMCDWYPQHQWHRFHVGEGVVARRAR